MTTTPRFALPLITPGQAQKEAYHNEALVAVDAAVHASVEGAPQNGPPANPVEGQCWIVGSAPTGAWLGKTDSLAAWTSGGWRFIAPVVGMTAWDKLAGHWRHWSGSVWSIGWPVASLRIGGQQVVGPRQPDVPSPSGGTTIDAEARATIGQLIVTLKSHGLID